MDDRRPKSEAADLEDFIAALEAAGQVNEVAGLRSGFASLDAAINGLSRGFYLLVGPPAAGKTSLTKQICDQAVKLNPIVALFFTCAEKKTDLTVRTLARLSGLETQEIRRGAGYLLHAYGVAKGNVTEDEMAPGWEKLKAVAVEAKKWLDRVYLIECDRHMTLADIERDISAARETSNSQGLLVTIDDAHRLGDAARPLDERLPLVCEKLAGLALTCDIPLLATWPEPGAAAEAERWAERAVGADVVMVLRQEHPKADAVAHRVALHIVKNRGGEKTTIDFDFTPGLAKFSQRAS
ncbi:MAG TPA: DnaB-like helicase C-terminal domain-containing protein [Verrucomicrobiae bacterium]|nr:DnaB-like helicase C-terminal domain-containing protein [Verrucomicrobiae bacterium]